MKAKLDEYFNSATRWQNEMNQLRKLVLECGSLQEDYKWKNPCYTYKDKNIAIISHTKNYCCLSFFKGVLLDDPNQILQIAGPNSRSAKILVFHSQEEILQNTIAIQRFIQAAITVEKKGVKVDFLKREEPEIPHELAFIFKNKPNLKEAFDNLTKGRQRGYLLYFNAAKQSQTVMARIEKYENRILSGRGMLDCVCGLSKRMPNCDGSHKHLS